MADLFISYSRKDTDFVRQLSDRLTARQREAWVDWRGIDYSTKWWEEICAGIEGADNFVFVISQDSLESAVCQREIEHARKFSKRIIPLLYHAIDEGAFVAAFYTDPVLRGAVPGDPVQTPGSSALGYPAHESSRRIVYRNAHFVSALGD